MTVASFSFDVPFEEAIAYATRRGVTLPADFYAALQESARTAAFTVSDIEALDQIRAILDSINDALRDGLSFAQWRESDAARSLPLTAARQELVFRNATQTAYSVGRTTQQREYASRRPFLMWDAINDSRTRPAHAEMNGYIAPVDDPIWSTWSPPAGHNCRCTRISLTERQARARGYPMAAPAVSPDPGWGYEKADADGAELDRMRDDRVAAMPPQVQEAARRGR